MISGGIEVNSLNHVYIGRENWQQSLSNPENILWSFFYVFLSKSFSSIIVFAGCVTRYSCLQFFFFRVDKAMFQIKMLILLEVIFSRSFALIIGFLWVFVVLRLEIVLWRECLKWVENNLVKSFCNFVGKWTYLLPLAAKQPTT